MIFIEGKVAEQPLERLFLAEPAGESRTTIVK
jgi:hypothetical protein